MSNVEKILVGIALAGIAVAVFDLTNSSNEVPPLSLAEKPRPEVPEFPSGPPRSAPAGPDAGLIEILRDPDSFRRVGRLAARLPKLGAGDVPEIRAALRSPEVDLVGAEIGLLVERWAVFEPDAAISWSFSRAPLGFRVPAVLAAVQVAALRDPLAAAAQVHEITGGVPGPNTEAAEVALIRGWFDSGKPGLADYVVDLGFGISQQRALGLMLRRSIQRDGPEPARRWVDSLPDEPAHFKLAALRQAFGEVAKLDHESALAWCEIHCGGPFDGNLREIISARWALKDGPAAMAWISTVEPGNVRDNAVLATYRAWQRVDGREVADWMAGNGPPEALADWLRPAAEIYSKTLAKTDPVEAIAWSARIPDEERRRRADVVIARYWRGMDEAAAEAWLQQSSLSEEERERARLPLP